MKNNPFNLTFGKEPSQMITRYSQLNEIIDTFTAKEPNQQIYMITGVRGCGKTVFMTSVAKAISETDEWIVIELNSSGELLKDLAAKLYSIKGLTSKYKAAGIDLSFWGIGVSIKKAEPITDLETAVEKMLDKLKDDGKRVLILIDEVSNTKEMRYFAGAFQIFIRHEYPLFLVMTGLYENINKLQNEENLTFLYRSPKIYLSPLNTFRMADIYETQLGIDNKEAVRLAGLTKGYSFAFQVFGYFIYNNKGDYKAALPNIRQYIDEYVYDKIWTELSHKEKEVLAEISTNGNSSVKEIKQNLSLKPNEFSVYRDRLVKKGILDGSQRGKLSFSLPFFAEYFNEHYDLEQQ